MEDECFPAIPLQNAWNRRHTVISPPPPPPLPPLVKQEPISRPESPACSSTSSPEPFSPTHRSPSPHSPAPLHALDYVIDHTVIIFTRK